MLILHLALGLAPFITEHSKSATAQTGNPYTDTDPLWKRLYFDEIKRLIEYSAAHSWRDCDFNCSCWHRDYEYPALPYVNLGAFLLADLNFCGTPELIFNGDEGSTSILAVVNNDLELLIYNWSTDWPPQGLSLYRRVADNALVYRFDTGMPYDPTNPWVNVNIFDDATIFDETVYTNTIIASYSEMYDYDFEKELNIYSYFFNNIEVSEAEYISSINDIMIDYKEVPYSFSILGDLFSSSGSWVNNDYIPQSHVIVTDADIIIFLDSYVPITTIQNATPVSPPSTDNSNITYISTAAELAAIGGAQSAGKTYILANDINITSTWTPIHDFQGTLDGAGHKITGLRTNVTTNMHSAGLFGTISTGNVTIKNLGVETGTGSVNASFQSSSGATRLYAGGLIGRCIGGTVSIENCYFNGNINVQSRIFNWVKTIQQFAGFLGMGPSEETILSLIFDTIDAIRLIGDLHAAYFDHIKDGNSYAYAGGLIGAVEGNAKVNINNSYSRGNVYSWASTHSILLDLYAFSYSGGIVGFKADGKNSTLSIGNSYSTANVTADGTSSFIREAANVTVNTFVKVFTFGLVKKDVLNVNTSSPLSYAGGLSGRRNPNTTTGNNYRLNTQIITARNINSTGTPLSHTAMQNRSSFVGWNFSNNTWTNSPQKNNGYPYPWIFDNKRVPEPAKPFSTFVGDFVVYTGLNQNIALSVDKDITQFSSVTVNEVPLTQDVHFTLTSGSTIVTLLPSFLDTLEEGYHALSVAFSDGEFVEEQFLIVENEMPYASKIVIDDELIFSDSEGWLVDDKYLDALTDNHYLRVEYTNDDIFEGEINFANLADAETSDISTQNNIRDLIIVIIAGIILVLLCFVLIFILRKRKSIIVEDREIDLCKSCGTQIETDDQFCTSCGSLVQQSIEKP